nr:amino acid racemase [Cytophagales bacterium]
MKTIGLIGGMSWESSALYYQIINQKTKEILGGAHSSKCLLHSMDFAEIAALQHDGNWRFLAVKMVQAAKKLEAAGAQLIVLCTNTMHKVAPDIERSIGVPFVHIVDAAAEQIQRKSMTRVGLLGTRFTMEESFMKDRYREHFGIDILTPTADEWKLVHDVIYEELVKGTIEDSSRRSFLRVIDQLVRSGASGIILSCTEIELLVGPSDTEVPLFQTTRIHVEKAVELALGERG